MRTYRAAPSQGPFWIAGMAVIILGLAVLPWLVGIPWLSLVFLLFAVFSLLLAFWLPGMRYELGQEDLVLRFGPVRYVIKLEDIREVTRRDLVLNPISSARGPGYALFRVPYAGVGTVTMCATRSLKNIILITTSRRKYGITPMEEEEFLRELTRRLERA